MMIVDIGYLRIALPRGRPSRRCCCSCTTQCHPYNSRTNMTRRGRTDRVGSHQGFLPLPPSSFINPSSVVVATQERQGGLLGRDGDRGSGSLFSGGGAVTSHHTGPLQSVASQQTRESGGFVCSQPVILLPFYSDIKWKRCARQF